MDNSPYIEADSSQVKKIARELAEKHPENAWAHVKLIYDWVRENIKYTRGDMKDTVQTLKDKTGDCEEMTSLFIAICRASRVPAPLRMDSGALLSRVLSRRRRWSRLLVFHARPLAVKALVAWPTICRSCRRAIVFTVPEKKDGEATLPG